MWLRNMRRSVVLRVVMFLMMFAVMRRLLRVLIPRRHLRITKRLIAVVLRRKTLWLVGIHRFSFYLR